MSGTFSSQTRNSLLWLNWEDQGLCCRSRLSCPSWLSSLTNVLIWHVLFYWAACGRLSSFFLLSLQCYFFLILSSPSFLFSLPLLSPSLFPIPYDRYKTCSHASWWLCASSWKLMVWWVGAAQLDILIGWDRDQVMRLRRYTGMGQGQT